MRQNVVIQIAVILCTITEYSVASTCSAYEAHIKDTSLQDKVLSGHSFKTFTGVTFGECSTHCGQSCRCRSFNLEIGGSGRCELNDADKEEASCALRARKGFIHVSFRPLTNENDTKAAAVCCVENMCENQGTCLPQIRSGKKSFICKCKVGYGGRLCKQKILGCGDYLRADELACSGLYSIPVNGETKTVYCHFDRVKWEAWTLLTSYSYSNNVDMKSLPLYQDSPMNEDNPVFGDKYRASLGLVSHVRNHSSFWRATCNHDTKPYDDDFMQSYFTTLDIMTYNTHSCNKIDLLNLYGTTYNDLNTFVSQDAQRTFSVGFKHGSTSCQPAMEVSIVDDGLFGYFYLNVPEHGCSASSESTTQYWFGNKL